MKRYFRSNKSNTNPNCNGNPTVLVVDEHPVVVTLTVLGETGNAITGGTLVLSEVTVPRPTYDANKDLLLANTTEITAGGAK